MLKNVASQVVTAMMRMSATEMTVLVPVSTQLITAVTNANPGVLTSAAAHSLVVGERVVISGASGMTAINGDWVVNSVPSTTTFSIAAMGTGTPLNTTSSGTYTANSGTMAPVPVHVMVAKDGGTPTLGTGTLTHIGVNAAGDSFTATANSLRSFSTQTQTAGISGSTALSNVPSSTLGLWSYVPTGSETNAAQVAFTFVASARSGTASGISVTQMFEPVNSGGGLQSVNLDSSQTASVAAAVMASTGDTSITLTKLLEMTAAFMAGKISVSSSAGVSTYTYKKRDGTTTSFTSLCSETDGTRSTTGALS